ncbi:MAG TPA: FAD-dependent monooxygenase [Hyphomicrobiaceae bacterium]|nr:FAD-dependent monooxygenase [Hyphomicrobiaceae bacterium]
MAADHNDPSVLIVGAGPTGLVAALELARRGVTPRIVDKAARPADGSRAVVINARTLELLSPLGLDEQLLEIGNTISRIEVRSGGRVYRYVRLGHMKHKQPALVVVAQTELQRVLTAALDTFGIPIEWGTELMYLSWGGGKAEATIATPDRTETISPDVLVGCDGAHSDTRQLSGIALGGQAQPAVFAVADIRYAFPRDASVASIEIVRGGTVVSFPFDAETFRHVGTSGDVVELVKNRRSASEILWHREFHVGLRQAERMQRGSVLLAGDAAHTHSPIDGYGMNLGIEDAAWLAYYVIRGEGETYAARRSAVSRRAARRTHRLVGQVFQTNVATVLMGHYLMGWLSRLPFVEQAVLRRYAGLDTPAAPWL